eukprot:TRINITY_DN39926_c0_g1_i1.p1 TRINITY_DN39926_c0_g1~~TRINITY_DN39926_c0_g1_i1.p1  ORF type:complete len:592 (+),score=113.78 TRINITY_DN39926_c0_g1_i1:266-1777(+)
MPDSPVFCSVFSTERDWRTAVAELDSLAASLLRSRSKKSWDFAVLQVSGHDDASVSDITLALDDRLGTEGALLGAAVCGSSGPCMDGARSRHAGPESGPRLQLLAVQIPEASKKQRAKPFFVGEKELREISGLVCRLQGQTRVQGAQEQALPRAWRQYLGVQSDEVHPRGVILFVDPLASKYVVRTALGALDLSFPSAAKCGGVCNDLPPGRTRLTVASLERQRQHGEGPIEVQAGVAGLLLPPELSLHCVVSPGSMRVGPELRVTSADGQVIKMLQTDDDKEAHSAAEILAAVSRDASPLQKLLIEKSGFLLGLEAPKQLDPDKSKVYDDIWGSSKRAPSYASLKKMTSNSDWLVRSLEALPSGSVVIRRDNLKRVPPRVGPAWLRCQLHVLDDSYGRQELDLMLQRYLGSRMTLPSPAGRPLAALMFTCSVWAANARAAMEEEVGLKEVAQLFGDDLPVVSMDVCGEVVPPGVTIGGMDQKRTTVQGHTATCCFLSYDQDA